ncbi:MAG: hypothetical protein JO370_09220, partial [Paucibacter sp.]|nr:hypothetical protein [Roseateles sp.]
SGLAVLLAPKGGRVHRLLGTAFFWSMCVAYAIGAAVAPFLDTGQRPNFIGGAFALYLTLTSWVTIKRRQKTTNLLDKAGLAVALLTAVSGAVLVRMAMHDASGSIDGAPPQSFYVFLVLGTAATLDDLLYLLRGGYTGAARIARHLWRMCAALFFAAGSFFLGQPQVFPEGLRDSALLFIPVVLPILVMLLWLVRLPVKAYWLKSARRSTAPAFAASPRSPSTTDSCN